MRHGKKLVIHVAQHVAAALVPVQGSTVLEPGRGQLYVRPISCHITSLPWQELEEELNKLLPMKVSGRDRNVKVEMFGCVDVIVFLCSN